MATDRQRFRMDVEAEILRRMREGRNAHMERAEVEEIGEGSGFSREEAAREFLRLAGTVWVGEITPEQGPSYWVFGPTHDPNWGMASFHVPWFQDRGLLF